VISILDKHFGKAESWAAMALGVGH